MGSKTAIESTDTILTGKAYTRMRSLFFFFFFSSGKQHSSEPTVGSGNVRGNQCTDGRCPSVAWLSFTFFHTGNVSVYSINVCVCQLGKACSTVT